ncbi:MAG: FlgD immunoglobulin-like domain containing protein, partial [bacterium]
TSVTIGFAWIAGVNLVDLQVNADAAQGIWNSLLVGIEDRVTTEFRSQVSLYQNTPNPFNPSTRIRYVIAKESMVTLRIYSTLGQTVRTLVNERQSPAHYEAVWDGRNDIGVQVPSGIYLYILQTESLRLTRKLIMLK